MINEFDITDFGASTELPDNTEAINAAAAKAADCGGTVIIPIGTFSCGQIRLRGNITVAGSPCFGKEGGSRLLLCDPTAEAQIIAEGADVTLSGLTLDGGGLGGNIHGVKYVKGDSFYSARLTADTCLITDFSGDGLRIEKADSSAIRHCVIKSCGRNGISVFGGSPSITDTRVTGCAENGVFLSEAFCAVLISVRSDSNTECGLKAFSFTGITAAGCIFDTNGDAGCLADGSEKALSSGFLLRGSVFTANSGAKHGAQVALYRCVAPAVTANTFTGVNNPINTEKSGNTAPLNAIYGEELLSPLFSANISSEGCKGETVRYESCRGNTVTDMNI